MVPTVPPYIELRPNRNNRMRAYVMGTRIRVQDIAIMAEVRGQSPDEIATALPHLSLAQVHAALSYYFDHRAEIQCELKEDEDFARQMRAKLGPGPLEQRLSNPMNRSDALPSG
jgi:uncharacterized protein (DUF433 family)